MLKEIAPLIPSSFFHIAAHVPFNKRTKLPDTSGLLSEEHFADVYLTWNEEGMLFEVKGAEIVDLFIDTRLTGAITPFCHHFHFTDEEAIELTKFRGEESRPLATQFEVKPIRKGLEIFLSKEALYGFEGAAILGFDMRLEHKGERQHYACSSRTHAQEKHPQLWGSIRS